MTKRPRKSPARGRRRRPVSRRTRSGRRTNRRRWRTTALKVALAGLVVVAGYGIYLDATIRAQFEGKRWTVPAHVYARPLELYPGMQLTASALQAELGALGYRRVHRAPRSGQFRRQGSSIEVVTRGFRFWDAEEPSRHLKAHFRNGTLVRMTGQDLGPLRLEPQRIGGIYPAHNEDRVLIRLRDTPKLLAKALVAVEDRGFYSHHGLSPRGIARAMWANIKAGGVVQGGSTLTQQLVKNYFLTSERSLWRKGQEAIMSLLLELHYDKGEILEAYLNEVYLGQAGPHAVHGFGLASHFYFAQPLEELSIAQTALLVALVRGASYYNPRRHPARAKIRRDRVLDILASQGVIDAGEAKVARREPLGVTPLPPGGTSDFPAFMDLVRRQLKRDYQEQALTSEGLRIFTTLDPRVQAVSEQALGQRTARLEKAAQLPDGSLEGAVVVSNASGEILALVGGRHARFAGFNRALDAVRPVGSLIKPAVYLAALSTGRYTLATPLDDTPLRVQGPDGEVWAPRNYDRQVHGSVPLHTALAQSYNLATARLGFAIGIRQVLHTLERLGVERDIPAYPAVFLGAVNLSPIDVAQMYQTLASGGFRTPIRSILEVTTADGEPLARYPLALEQVASPENAYLLTAALQSAVSSGTGRSLAGRLPAGMAPAGKTGTTDELRDSWFAGYTGDFLVVTWLGRDDNKPAGLTGAGGAMQVWADILIRLRSRPLNPVQPPNVEYAWVDGQGRLSGARCSGAVQLPFVRGTLPTENSACVGDDAVGAEQDVMDWLRSLID
ncbi:MAG: penicillin-binding protein 1B [Gammaproteobacteria bacterium]|nr:penicillin-binding protein 1B [Gammaproteobacteria bacterium]